MHSSKIIPYIHFPIIKVNLKKADIRLVNIGKLLSDAKSDRSSKADGIITCSYYEHIDILFLLAGEPVNAVRILPSRYRFSVSINEVITRAKSAEFGHVSLYHTDKEVLFLLFNGAINSPLFYNFPSRLLRLKDFVKFLIHQKVTGVLEFCTKDELNFITFESGSPRRIFLCEGRKMKSNQKIMVALTELFLIQDFYLYFFKIPNYFTGENFVQVSPALIDFFSKIFLDIFKLIAKDEGASKTVRNFSRINNELREDFPFLNNIVIDRNGNLNYNGIAKPETFVFALSAWLNSLTTFYAKAKAPEIVYLIKNILEPYNVTLHSLDFYNNCPILGEGK